MMKTIQDIKVKLKKELDSLKKNKTEVNFGMKTQAAEIRLTNRLKDTEDQDPERQRLISCSLLLGAPSFNSPEVNT